MLTLKVDPYSDFEADCENLETKVTGVDPAKVAFVVRAVNTHEALVSALEAMCEEQRHPSPAYEAAQKLLSSLG